MGLSDREKMEITEVVLKVLDARLSELRDEIVAGFVECLDWHNENFARIMEARNNATIAEITKAKREVIEIRSQREQQRQQAEQQEQQEAKRKSERLGFKKAGT